METDRLLRFILPNGADSSGAPKMLHEAHKGDFVPVVGFDAALVQDQGSPQFARLRQASTRLAELGKVGKLRDAPRADYRHETSAVTRAVSKSRDEDEITKPRDEVEKRVFDSYLPELGRRLDWPPPKTVDLPQDELVRLLIAFELKVAELAVCLTTIWAGHLMSKPQPLGSLDDAPPVEIAKSASSTAWRDTAYDYMAEAVRLLKQASKKLGTRGEASNRTLALDGIMLRLLGLIVEVVGDEDEFWVERHKDFANDHHAVIISNDGLKVPVRRGVPDVQSLGLEAGIRSAHLLWLEYLLEHLLLAGTGAYRTYEQLGFALSLAPPRPAVPVRLPETPLVGQMWCMSQEKNEAQLIGHLLAECDADRRPSSFSVALAAVVYANHETVQGKATADSVSSPASGDDHISAKAEDMTGIDPDEDIHMTDDPLAEPGTAEKKPAHSGGTKQGWVLSTCLDLEVEKGLSLFGPFRVLLPVVTDDRPDPQVWLIGAFAPRGDPGMDPPSRPLNGWHEVTASTESLAVGDGPIVVKLSGSPLHEIRESPVVTDAPGGLAGSLRHHVVIGEQDLMQFFQGVLPRPPHAPDTIVDDIVTSERRHLFFLGHDSSRWGDRAYYYGWSSHFHGRPGEATPKEEAVSTQVCGEERCQAYGDTDALGDRVVGENVYFQQGIPISQVTAGLVEAFGKANPQDPFWKMNHESR